MLAPWRRCRWAPAFSALHNRRQLRERYQLRRKAARATGRIVYQERLRPRAWSARQHQPQIEIEDHALGVPAARLAQREVRTGAVLDGDQPRAQGADVAAAGNLGDLQHLGPGVDLVARKAGRHVSPAVDGGDVEGVGEAIEGQRPRERDDNATVDEASPELALRLLVQIEMHLGGVLVEARGGLVL